ncbi:hypothetical protein C3L33_00362, partial [Rhododendron williamsianum]
MAWALLSPLPPPLNLPTSSSSTTYPTINTAATAATNGRGYRRRKRATSLVIAKASEKGDAKSKDTTPEFNPFGFVTDNPSSRSAIQLPESPAEDGNVGQMLYRIAHGHQELLLATKNCSWPQRIALGRRELLLVAKYYSWPEELLWPQSAPPSTSLVASKETKLKLQKKKKRKTGKGIFFTKEEFKACFEFCRDVLYFEADNQSHYHRVKAEEEEETELVERIEGKGKDFGSYIKSGGFRWFVRETGSQESRRGTIIFLHGAPTQSYSYRVVMSEMADAGFHCFAPDWIGFGFTDKPQPGYGFDYTEKEFHAEFDKLLEALEVKSPFFLVVQGFLVGSYGLTWALKNPSKIAKLAIFNSPLTVSSPIPGLFQQLSNAVELNERVDRIPLYGEFTCQNAIIAERFVEAALLEAARKANFRGLSSQIAAGFGSGRLFSVLKEIYCKNLMVLTLHSSSVLGLWKIGFTVSWDKPILVAWGIADKHLPQSVAEEFQKGNPSNVKLKLIEGAGHMPQEDWPEKVVEALRVFF